MVSATIVGSHRTSEAAGRRCIDSPSFIFFFSKLSFCCCWPSVHGRLLVLRPLSFVSTKGWKKSKNEAGRAIIMSLLK